MRFITLLLAVLLLWGCCSSRKGQGDVCDTSGIVRDFSNLDGCRLLIELPNGDLLNPAVLPEGSILIAGQRISFSFRELADHLSICMAEKAIVEVTCLKTYDPNQVACITTDNPFEVPWMNDAFDRLNPVQIIRYRNAEPAYLFRAVGEEYLYDCRGQLICKGTGEAQDECRHQHIAPLGHGKIIWQGEGVWD